MTLAADLARASDPVAMARSVGTILDPWQSDLVRSTAQRILVVASRQAGKTEAIAMLAVWTAAYRPGSLALIVSPSQRQSSEVFRRCVAIYRRLGRPVPAENETAATLALENGSRIVALPGTDASIRGYAVGTDGVLLLDEASRIEDDTFTACMPMVAGGGRVIATTTPWGQRGWFHDRWQNGGSTWHRVTVPATDCPRITPEYLAEQRAQLGAWFYEQEFLCSFKDSTDQLFTSEILDRIFTADAEHLDLFPALEAIA